MLTRGSTLVVFNLAAALLASSCSTDSNFFGLLKNPNSPSAVSFSVTMEEDSAGLSGQGLQGVSGFSESDILKRLKKDPSWQVPHMQWCIVGMTSSATGTCWMTNADVGHSTMLTHNGQNIARVEMTAYDPNANPPVPIQWSVVPEPDVFGVFQFQYRCRQDDNGEVRDSDIATVTLNITNTNDGPTAISGPASTNEDVNIVNVALSASDPDNDTLNFQLISGTSNGTVTITPQGRYTYAPTQNYFGSDAFTFRVSDGILSSDATISITVNPVNDAPVADAKAFAATEDQVLTGISGSGSDIEDGTNLTYEITTNGTKGVANINPNTGAITYSPTLNQNGIDTFSYRVRDTANLASAVATVTLTIAPVNDAPVAANYSFATNEDVTFNGSLVASAMDVDLDALTFAKVGNPSHGTVTVNANGTFVYVPTQNYSGPDSFTFRVSDGQLFSNTATVSVTVNPVNDAPIAQNGTLAVIENTPQNGVLVATDIDSPSLTYTIVAQGTKGAVVITNPNSGAYTYTPNQNTSGADSFTFRANDGTLNSNTATILVTLSAVNDPPIAVNGARTTNEDTPILDGQVIVTDPETNPIQYSLVSGASNGTVNLNQNSGAFTYTPNLNFFGTDQFTFRGFDGQYFSNTATFTLTVLPINDAPVAQNAVFSVQRNGQHNGQLVATDVDNPPSQLSFFVLAPPQKGNVVVNTNGSFTYTPSNGAVGADSFTFYARDPGLLQSNATVDITISDDPVCVAESFNQVDPTNKLELLFVVDTSSSLNEERQAIAQGIGNFISNLGAGVEYKIAVMLAHGTGTHSGALFKKGSEPRVLDSSIHNQQTILNGMNTKLNSPPEGNPDGGEAMIYSLHTALTNPTKKAAIQAEGFFQEGSYLAVVFVSDENDVCVLGNVLDPQGGEVSFYNTYCNVQPNPVTPVSVYNKLVDLKGTNLSVNGIVYTTPVPASGENEMGLGMLEMIALSNGVAADLSQSSMIGQNLGVIGESVNNGLDLILAYIMQFVADSVTEVTVNNQPIPFNFAAAANQVTWSAEDAGEVDDLIEINYCHREVPHGGISLADPPGLLSGNLATQACLGSVSQSGFEATATGGGTCDGKAATIYVNGNMIVGGPLNGQVFTGTLTGTAGDDVIIGTDGADLINAGGGNDVICALGGNDTVNGESGDDAILGGDGNNILNGGADHDSVIGGSGADTIHGNAGNDLVCGSNGSDQLFGDDNNDTLIGGNGTDSSQGGAGIDKCLGSQFALGCE